MIFQILIGIIIILPICVLLYMKLPQFGAKVTKARIREFEASPQFKKGRFRNYEFTRADMSFSKLPKLMQQSLFSGVEKVPNRKLPQMQRDKRDFVGVPDDSFRMTWFGHSAYLLEIDGKKILLDPMLGPAASPVFFAVKRFNQTLPLSAEDLPELDAVIFTHDHYDHLDYSTILKIKDKVSHFYTPLGVGDHLIKWGVSPERITQLDWWQDARIAHLTLVCTPTQHFSGRTFADRDRTLWSSWVLQSKDKNLFFNGDSGYFRGFKEIGDRFGPFDVCYMECGQYHYMWKENHMVPEETAQAFLDLQGKQLIPVHWGSFTLAPHDWYDPIERLTKICDSSGIHLVTPKIGETIDFNDRMVSVAWWKENM